MKARNLAYIATAVIALALAAYHFAAVRGAQSGNAYAYTPSNVSIGNAAPNYPFQLANGSVEYLSSYKGQALLLWFVVTWCGTCAQGNQVLASNIQFFKQHNVKILELEQYKDLGQNGMPITSFVDEFAGNDSYIQAGYASYNMTIAYNTPPNFQLDIYYIISPSGKVIYSGTNLPGSIGEIESIIARYGL